MNRLLHPLILALMTGLFATTSQSAINQTKGDFVDSFRQLDESLPTPNVYRNASGQPGHQYWQQQADYTIRATLNEDERSLSANLDLSYRNNSPDSLSYLWLQLDQNKFRSDSMAELTAEFAGNGSRGSKTSATDGKEPHKMSLGGLRRQQFMADNELGYDILTVTAGNGRALPHTIVGTLMRVDLPRPLKPGQRTSLSIDYRFNILEEDAVWARGGYEHFPDDEREGGNDIFLIAQWFPRMVAYTDYEGWTNKEFIGRGEFTLEFGNYTLELTVPDDHIVSSTGALENASEVLTATQRQRLKEAETAERPVFVVTAEEALKNEKDGTDGTKTWIFKADNVRDVAWASSRKFIWDAKGYQQGGDVQPLVMAMSFYPKEGEPLWSKYSTESVIHTMEVFSRFSFDYPYPTAQSVNGPVGGMEYPMITFNGPRTDLQDDGRRTYTLAEKRFLIGVVIHEVGHIYFPMIVNSDERQWTWMDEGLNSYLDGVAGREWDPDMPWGVEPRGIVDYMKSDQQVPIMTQSDSVLNLGPNAYGKPAVALNILRETILGRELFDFALREYANRWRFKRPTPADFFRTMEEASGVDLDWFWRGWFYSTDHVDLSLDKIYQLRLDTQNPDIDFGRRRQEEADKPPSLYVMRNHDEGKPVWVDANEDVRDFYDDNDRFTPTNADRNTYTAFLDELEDWEKAALARAIEEDQHYYVFEFSNLGGLPMPILLELTYADESTEMLRIPAEIWRRSHHQVQKLITRQKTLVSAVIDPLWETADVDVENNHYPRRIIPSRIESFKDPDREGWEYREIMRDLNIDLEPSKAEKEAMEAEENEERESDSKMNAGLEEDG